MADHHARHARARARARLDREPRVVDRAERGARDDEQRKSHALREVGHRELRVDRHEQAARPLHDEELRGARAGARSAASIAARSMARPSARAATAGAAASANGCGQTSARGSRSPAARRNAIASAGPPGPTPVSIGFIAPASIPRARSARTSAHATTRLADSGVGAGHEHAARPSGHRMRETSSATASATASISSSRCVAIGVRRSRAVPSGTDGWRIPCA